MRSKVLRAMGVLAVAGASLFASGCYKATFIDPNAIRGAEHDEWTDFFLFGLVGTEDYDVRQFCRGPVAMVRTGANFGTGVVSIVTLGIYTPRKVYVTCAAAPGVAKLPPGVRRIRVRTGSEPW